MDRKSKIKFLISLEKGKQAIKTILPIVFIELGHYRYKPGIYFTIQGESISEEDLYDYIKEKEKNSSLVWLEIRTLK